LNKKNPRVETRLRISSLSVKNVWLVLRPHVPFAQCVKSVLLVILTAQYVMLVPSVFNATLTVLPVPSVMFVILANLALLRSVKLALLVLNVSPMNHSAPLVDFVSLALPVMLTAQFVMFVTLVPFVKKLSVLFAPNAKPAPLKRHLHQSVPSVMLVMPDLFVR
jgi:hypothetical protein